jgi:non-specific serine/threonine protein kinase
VVTNAIYPEYFGSYAFGALQSSHWEKQDETVCGTQNLVSPFILRRTKEQVLKTYRNSEQVFYCDMEPEQEKLYEEEKSKARNAL